MQKFSFIALSILVIFGCEDNSPGFNTCYGSVTKGTIWISISSDNKISIGNSVFSERLLKEKYNIVKQSCKSVVVMVQAEELAKHEVVYDTIKLVESLNFEL